jgi:hypothetical protein
VSSLSVCFVGYKLSHTDTPVGAFLRVCSAAATKEGILAA